MTVLNRDYMRELVDDTVALAVRCILGCEKFTGNEEEATRLAEELLTSVANLELSKARAAMERQVVAKIEADMAEVDGFGSSYRE